MNGKKMTRALNRVAEPVKEESMWKGRASAEVLRAALVIVMVAGLGVGSAAGKGKPPKEPEPVTRYEVRYEIEPLNHSFPFNFIPDGEGLFGGDDGVLDTFDEGCVLPDCPYVDGEGDFTITQDGEGWRMVQWRDRDLKNLYTDTELCGKHDTCHFNYRHFWTDIELQTMVDIEDPEDDMCPSLVFPGRGLGPDYSEEPDIVRVSLYIDAWPEATQIGVPIETTGYAYVNALVPVQDATGEEISLDYDSDSFPEPLLYTGHHPYWTLAWGESEFPGSNNLLVTAETDGTFTVQSPEKAMLLVFNPKRGGKRENCGYVFARFEFEATVIEE